MSLLGSHTCPLLIAKYKNHKLIIFKINHQHFEIQTEIKVGWNSSRVWSFVFQVRSFSKKDPFNDKSMESELQKTTSEESNLRSKWDDNIGCYLADALVGRVWKGIEQGWFWGWIQGAYWNTHRYLRQSLLYF